MLFNLCSPVTVGGTTFALGASELRTRYSVRETVQDYTLQMVSLLTIFSWLCHSGGVIDVHYILMNNDSTYSSSCWSYISTEGSFHIQFAEVPLVTTQHDHCGGSGQDIFHREAHFTLSIAHSWSDDTDFIGGVVFQQMVRSTLLVANLVMFTITMVESFWFLIKSSVNVTNHI